jgi:hypothetical protein
MQMTDTAPHPWSRQIIRRTDRGGRLFVSGPAARYEIDGRASGVRGPLESAAEVPPPATMQLERLGEIAHGPTAVLNQRHISLDRTRQDGGPSNAEVGDEIERVKRGRY